MQVFIGDMVIAVALGYVVGSFPTGVLVTKLLGKPDVRFSGSGHTGGLNTLRQSGWPGAVMTAVVDIGKGVLAAWLALRLTDNPWALVGAGVAAITGHCWSVFVGFAGGMGLGVMGGLFLWLLPWVVPVAAALWGLLKLLMRDSPRAVMVMTVLMVPVFWLAWWLGHASPEVLALGLAGLVVIFIRHLTQLKVYEERMPSR
jgi:glycerol-3-phosphate acyltransferase PlsY